MTLLPCRTQAKCAVNLNEIVLSIAWCGRQHWLNQIRQSIGLQAGAKAAVEALEVHANCIPV